MVFKTLKTKLPWWTKIGAKIVVSRLPLESGFWKSLNLFEHGFMEKPDYAYQVFQDHFARASQEIPLKPGFVSLELGPGESLNSALVSHSFGSSKAYIVDVARFATEDIQIYQEMANFLREKGLEVVDLQDAQSMDDVIERCGGSYLTSGMDSLQSIEDNSVDFIWSHAVLEHVKRYDFLNTMKELRRIIRHDGVCSHEVDLKDHLELSLNNLRFGEKIWESNLMANSGFYTNRIQYPQMLSMFEEAGFEVQVTDVKKWAHIPLERSKLNEQFQKFSDEDLRVSDFCVVLKPV